MGNTACLWTQDLGEVPKTITVDDPVWITEDATNVGCKSCSWRRMHQGMA
jgi:hypothetical protein